MRSLICLFTAIAPLLLTSCVMSKKPLSDAKMSKVDSHLLGTWHQVKTSGDPYSMTIGKKSGTSNLMEWTSRSREKERHDVFALAGKTKYLSIALQPEAYLIGKYTTPDANTFELHVVDPWIVGKAVEDGKLKGEARRNNDGGYNSVMLAEPPAKILAYLAENAATCFSKEPLVFKKRLPNQK